MMDFLPITFLRPAISHSLIAGGVSLGPAFLLFSCKPSTEETPGPAPRHAACALAAIECVICASRNGLRTVVLK